MAMNFETLPFLKLSFSRPVTPQGSSAPKTERPSVIYTGGRSVVGR
jgi:hypothetical protein